MRKTFDVVNELSIRAASLESGPRAAVEALLPIGSRYFSDLSVIDGDENLSEVGKAAKRKAALQVLRAGVAELRAEKPGNGSGGYRHRIAVERASITREAMKNEPDPRAEAARRDRGERLLRSFERAGADSLEVQSVFWQLSDEDREFLEQAAGTRVMRMPDRSISVAPWAPRELADRSRAARLEARSPEAAKRVQEFERDLATISHFENLLVGIATEAAGGEPEDEIRVA